MMDEQYVAITLSWTFLWIENLSQASWLRWVFGVNPVRRTEKRSLSCLVPMTRKAGIMADEKCIHCDRDDEGDVLACDLKLKLRAAKDKHDTLLTEISGLRGLVRAVASETSIPMEEIEQSIDAVSGTRA